MNIAMHPWCRSLFTRASWVYLGGTLAIAVAACSRRTADSLEGRWEADSKTESVEFQSDGRIEAVDRHGNRLAGHFAVLDNGYIRLDMTTSSTDKSSGTVTGGRMFTVCRYEVRNGTLTMTEEDGATHRYSRAP